MFMLLSIENALWSIVRKRQQCPHSPRGEKVLRMVLEMIITRLKINQTCIPYGVSHH